MQDERFSTIFEVFSGFHLLICHARPPTRSRTGACLRRWWHGDFIEKTQPHRKPPTRPNWALWANTRNPTPPTHKERQEGQGKPNRHKGAAGKGRRTNRGSTVCSGGFKGLGRLVSLISPGAKLALAPDDAHSPSQPSPPSTMNTTRIARTSISRTCSCISLTTKMVHGPRGVPGPSEVAFQHELAGGRDNSRQAPPSCSLVTGSCTYDEPAVAPLSAP